MNYSGIWGANLQRSANRDKILKAADELFKDPRLYKLVIHDRKGIDQELLTTHIWPLTLLNDDSVIIIIAFSKVNEITIFNILNNIRR